MTRRAFPLVVLLVTAGVPLLTAQPPVPELDKRLAKATKEFAIKVGEAKTAAGRDFAAMASQVKLAPGLTPAAKADKLDAIRKAQAQFQESGRFPPDDAFAEPELRYMLAVNTAFLPLAALADAEIDQGIKKNNPKRVEAGRKLRAELEAQLPGGGRAVRPGVWRGTLHHGRRAIPYHLHVHKATDGTFSGHVEDNPGVAGNWGYDVDGQTSGLGVEFKLTRSTRGNFTAVRGLGVVSGDRLIANVTSTTGGRSTTGLAVLTRSR